VFTGYVAGKAVAHLKMAADPVPSTLQVEPDDVKLSATPRDSTRIIVRALDQAGQILPFLADPVSIRVEGAARLIGPEVLTLQGGTSGFWVESTGAQGAIDIEISSLRFPKQFLKLKAE
jgi:beta-galactosidase